MTNVAHPIKWSYSRLKTYKTCPRKYQVKYITGEFQDVYNEAANDGLALHNEFESAARDRRLLSPSYAHLQDTFDALQAIPGEKFYEHKVAFTSSLEPTSFDGDGYWYRGILDWFCIKPSGKEALIVDYKNTTKPEWLPWEELELFSAAVFINYPNIDKITGAMWGVVHKYFIPREYYREQLDDLLLPHIKDVYRMKLSYENDVWNATPNGLCRNYCPVETCEHYKRGVKSYGRR